MYAVGLQNCVDGLKQIICRLAEKHGSNTNGLLISKRNMRLYGADHTDMGGGIVQKNWGPIILNYYMISTICEIMEGELLGTHQDFNEYFGPLPHLAKKP